MYIYITISAFTPSASTGTSLFGQPTQQATTGLFGGTGTNKPLFGTSTATSTPAFGFGGAATTSSTSLFGNTQNKVYTVIFYSGGDVCHTLLHLHYFFASNKICHFGCKQYVLSSSNYF